MANSLLQRQNEERIIKIPPPQKKKKNFKVPRLYQQRIWSPKEPIDKNYQGLNLTLKNYQDLNLTLASLCIVNSFALAGLLRSVSRVDLRDRPFRAGKSHRFWPVALLGSEQRVKASLTWRAARRGNWAFQEHPKKRSKMC